MFGKRDVSDGSIRYCDEREPAHNATMIVAALGTLSLVENLSTRLDILIKEVFDLHHRVHPVGGENADRDSP
jgi:hypothetical protein